MSALCLVGENRESGIGNRESGIGNRKSVAGISGEPGNRLALRPLMSTTIRHCLRAIGACPGAPALLARSGGEVRVPAPARLPPSANLLRKAGAAGVCTERAARTLKRAHCTGLTTSTGSPAWPQLTAIPKKHSSNTSSPSPLLNGVRPRLLPWASSCATVAACPA
ncbi:hypothetical protein HZS92_00522 [Xanthomonas citri pv. citri]|nr:hypothetical protein HZS91_00521 [Xanthomonas citri pv. citri]QYF38501.1 hypothetical protein HZS92_00522 [Xanthomonas citri pv. citri]QYF43271.1 hypothetical protein HZS93_00521 [Xanthomonas citri]